MKRDRHTLLLASSLAMMTGVGMFAEAEPTLRSAGSANNRRPTPPRRNTAVEREIAEHNAAVDRRKAAKRARQGRR